MRQARLARNRERLSVWIPRLVTFLIFVTLWEFGARTAGNPVLATFFETVVGFAELARFGGDLWHPMWISNQAMLLGFGAAVVTAIPLGLAAGRSVLLDRASDPYLAIFLAIPISPLIPIVIIALGIGLSSRVLIVYFFAFVFMAINTRAGVRQVDKSLPEMAESFGGTERQIWRLVVLPGALPAIFAGLRIGLGRSIAGMVIVELLLVASGIGRILLATSARLQGGLLFGVVLAVVLESTIFLSVMRWIENRATPWAHDVSV